MTSQLHLFAAGFPVHVTVKDDDMAGQLAELWEASLTDTVHSHPWLSVEIHPGAMNPSLPPSVRARAELLDDGSRRFSGPEGWGRLDEAAGERILEVEAGSLRGASQLLRAAVAYLLPFEGGCLLHADTLIWRGKAIAFAGPSGTGKTTTSGRLARELDAAYLAMDATPVFIAEGESQPTVATMPRAVPGPQKRSLTGRIDLAAVVFPKQAETSQLVPLETDEAFSRIMGAVHLTEAGGATQGQVALRLAQAILETTKQAIVHHSLHDDLRTRLEEGLVFA